MLKKSVFILLIFAVFTTGAFPSGFLNIGDFDSRMGVFFGLGYSYSWRDVYLGTNDSLLYNLKHVDYNAVVGVNVSDYIALYAIAGMDEFQFEDNIEGEYDFKFGGGVRIKLVEFMKIALRAGQSESKTFDVSLVTDFRIMSYASSGAYILDTTPYDVDWVEYQGILATTVEVDPLIFYLGGKIAILQGNISPAFFNETTFENDGVFSILVGGQIKITDQIVFGAEITFLEETCISSGIQFQF